MNRYKVVIPVTLTIEVDAHSVGDIQHVVADAFAYEQSRDPLEGMKFVLPALNVQNAQIMTCVLAKDFDPTEIEAEELYEINPRRWRER